MTIKSDGGVLAPRDGLYIIKRTSGRHPCPDAVKVRATTTTSKAGLQWEFVWMIEIDDLMNFVDENGECIISLNKDGFATIEIFDDYR